MDSLDVLVAAMAANGFVVVPSVYSSDQVEAMTLGLEAAFIDQPDTVARSEAGSVYAARNLLTLWPETADVCRQPPMPEVLAALMGNRYGLVRALYFDKPPERTWALPWHKDMTIAVRDNRMPSRLFSKATQKAGVPHVEAPVELLETMVTARIHLDEVTEDNGPLKVVSGSHRTGKQLCLGKTPPWSVLAGRGDVLLMRPLLAHASGHSTMNNSRHRRILHLEFAGRPELPDGYCWHNFRPGIES